MPVASNPVASASRAATPGHTAPLRDIDIGLSVQECNEASDSDDDESTDSASTNSARSHEPDVAKRAQDSAYSRLEYKTFVFTSWYDHLERVVRRQQSYIASLHQKLAHSHASFAHHTAVMTGVASGRPDSSTPSYVGSHRTETAPSVQQQAPTQPTPPQQGSTSPRRRRRSFSTGHAGDSQPVRNVRQRTDSGSEQSTRSQVIHESSESGRFVDEDFTKPVAIADEKMEPIERVNSRSDSGALSPPTA